MWFLFRRDITVSAPADTTPIPIGDLLISGWAYRKTCIDVGDCMGMLTWLEAFDALLDRLLLEHPEFAIYSAGLVAA